MMGFWIVVFGLLAVIAVFAIAIFQYGGNPQNVVAVIGPVLGVVGTLCGAFFGINAGIRAGLAGKAEAEKARDDATNKAIAMAAMMPPEKAPELLRSLGIASVGQEPPLPAEKKS
jgi:hypothetical protein